jgi:hypothetical protein
VVTTAAATAATTATATAATTTITQCAITCQLTMIGGGYLGMQLDSVTKGVISVLNDSCDSPMQSLE